MSRRRTLAFCAAACVVGFAYVLLLEASARLAGSVGRALAEWQAAPASSSAAIGEKDA